MLNMFTQKWNHDFCLNIRLKSLLDYRSGTKYSQKPITVRAVNKIRDECYWVFKKTKIPQFIIYTPFLYLAS